MKPRTTIILALLAVILVGIALLSTRSERSKETLASAPIFPGLEADRVARIWLASDADTVELVRPDDTWLVATEGDYPADPQTTERMLEKIELFDRKYLRSQNPEMQTSFEVDDTSGVEVLMAGESGEALAHFRMGKNGPDFRSQYVRPVAANDVYLIPDYLKSSFDPGRSSWRDKTIFSFEGEKVKELRMEPASAEPIVITKNEEGTFVMTEPESAAVKRNLVDSTVRTLANLRCDAFPDSVPSLADAGLAPPQQSVEVALDDGASYTLHIGNETDNARIYVRRPDRETIFQLSKGRVNSLIRTAEDLKEPPPEPAEPAETPELEIGEGGASGALPPDEEG